MHELEFAQSLANKACHQFSSRGHKVVWAEAKKNILAFKLQTKRWRAVELVSELGGIESDLITQFYCSLDKVVVAFAKPLLEEHYQAKVVNVFLPLVYLPTMKSIGM